MARSLSLCCLNGPAARSGATGDIVVIITYGMIDAKEATAWQPVKIFVNGENKPVDR